MEPTSEDGKLVINPWAMTPEQLAKCLDADRIDPAKAKEIVDAWQRLYPQIAKLREKLDRVTRNKERR